MSKKKIKGIIIGLAVVFGLIMFIFGLSYYEKNYFDKDTKRKIEESTTKESKEKDKKKHHHYEYLEFGLDLYKYSDDINTYLLIGTDGSGNEDADDESYRGTMADFLLVLFVNNTTEKYGFVQINRDTITDVTTVDSTGEGEGMEELQICTAHWYGKDKEQSCENTEEAVSLLLGEIEIDGYYCINMENIGIINNLVGGVEVTIEDDFSGEDESLVMGETILLNDEQAEHFVRARMGVGDGENTSRMRRQRTYMSAYFNKALDLIKSDNNFVNDAFVELQDVAVTDISGKSLSVISNSILKYENIGILTFDGESKKGKKLGDGLLHAEFYPNRDSIIENLSKIMNLEPDEE